MLITCSWWILPYEGCGGLYIGGGRLYIGGGCGLYIGGGGGGRLYIGGGGGGLCI